MIAESKTTGQKVPAISTSEDSNEEKQSPLLSSSELCIPDSQTSKSSAHSSSAASDESRDIGETGRVVATKTQRITRDELNSLTSSQQTSPFALASVSPQLNAGSDHRQSKHDVNVGMASAPTQVNKIRDEKKQHSQLPMPMASIVNGTESGKIGSSLAPSGATKKMSHSLLPSASTSFDPVVDHPQWRKHAVHSQHAGRADLAESNQASKPRHRRLPATTNFTLPAPTKPTPRKPEFGDDEASFNLFTQSFDTISDTATFIRDFHHTEPAGTHGDGLSPSFSMLGLHQQHRRDASHNMDISLPSLGHHAGDISPIRVSAENRYHGRPMEAIPVHFPQDEDAAAHAFGYNVGGCNAQVAPTINPYGGSVVSNPFFVLRCAREAFSKCTFLLSCLSVPDPCAVNVSDKCSFQLNNGSDNQVYREQLSPQVLKVASRRVGAAICAFGGYIEPEQNSIKHSSIFRPKGEVSSTGIGGMPVSRLTYEEGLRSRYFMSGSHISWEVEQNPPVEASDSNQTRENILAHMNTGSESYIQRDGQGSPPNATTRATSNKPSSSRPLSPYSSIVEMTSNGSEPPRMKYRCKLCGQPKQNHNCPYQQSLLRSIGISVHPAVNSFTAREPGALTPALSEMNNFVSYDSEHAFTEPLRSTSLAGGKNRRTHPTVTPDAFRPGVLLSPQSSLSTQTPSPETTPLSARQKSGSREIENSAQGNDTRKRSHSEMEPGVEITHDTSVPFIEEVVLRPEQYRAVTRSKNPEPGVGSYQYPVIPLTYTERQRLSDTLFVLSRQIPTVTEECASILSRARMENKWDLAIAELLTQLVVGLFCQEGDRSLDGLQRYLLYLGISS